MKNVRCINAHGGSLVNGQVYEVNRELVDHAGINRYGLKGVFGSWYTDRFEIVEDEKPKQMPSPAIAAVMAKVEEEPDWKKMRDCLLLPGECVCKIPRQQCDFHRD